MQWHIDQAAACGATQQEILEAVEVGIEMGAGRVTVSARFALEVMERAFSPNKAPQAPAAAPGS
jgi:alkylhydroperoxidase/carboxymuconolactone decarboxylase family protein YurZ